MASSTLARLCTPKTEMSTIVPEARIGAINARCEPTTLPRATTVRRTGRTPMSSAATAMRPVGPVARENEATITATANGNSRLVAMARSTDVQVSSAPSAIAGSGRRPLLKAIQKARNTAAALHTTTGVARAARPSRGRTSRLMIIQHSTAAISAGRRIHGLAVDTCENSVSRS